MQLVDVEVECVRRWLPRGSRIGIWRIMFKNLLLCFGNVYLKTCSSRQYGLLLGRLQQ